MSDIVERLRATAAAITDWNGEVMKAWDSWVAYYFNAGKEGKAIGTWPRDCFESYLDSYAQDMRDADTEISRLREANAALTRENEALKAALSTARENALREAAEVAITPIRFECCNNPTWSGYQEDEPKCCGNPNAEWGNPGEISEAILALITKPQD